MNPEVYTKVSEYVKKNYSSYKDVELIITETDSVFFISKHINDSPLILSKGILN